METGKIQHRRFRNGDTDPAANCVIPIARIVQILEVGRGESSSERWSGVRYPIERLDRPGIARVGRRSSRVTLILYDRLRRSRLGRRSGLWRRRRLGRGRGLGSGSRGRPGLQRRLLSFRTRHHQKCDDGRETNGCEQFLQKILPMKGPPKGISNLRKIFIRRRRAA